MKVILRMNDFNYDITHLVDTSNLEKPVEMKLTIDGQFHTGSILLKSLTRYELGEQIDLSRTLIRNSLVTIEIDNVTTQWRIMSDNVTDNLNGTYTHEIGLIDRRSELTGINLPNLSLTQESFVSSEKARAVLNSDTNNKIDAESGIIKFNSAKNTFDFFTIHDITKSSVSGYSGILLDADFGTVATNPALPPSKVAANICVSGLNEVNVDHEFKFGNGSTTSVSSIDTDDTGIILKNRNYTYSIEGGIRAYDSTPQITTNSDYEDFLFAGGRNVLYTTSGISYTDLNKYVIIKAYSDGVEIYSESFKVSRSTIDISKEHCIVEFPITNIKFNFNYKPTTDNQKITFKSFVRYFPWQTGIESSLRLDNFKFGRGRNRIKNYPDELPPLYGFGNIPGQGYPMETCITNGLTITGSEQINHIYYTAERFYDYFYYDAVKDNQGEGSLYYARLAELPTYLSIVDYNITASTDADIENTSGKTIYDWINHCLRSIYADDEESKYSIEASTAARLMQIISPEFTIKDYNLYQLLNEISEFLGGVNWEITPNNEIKFIFFDELEIKDLPSEDIDEQAKEGISDLNGYQSSIQLNAENVALQSLVKEGWYSIRAEDSGNIQIKNDSIMIKTNYPINNIYKVEQRGINYNVPGHDADTSINITPRVVEYEEWKTLPSQFSASTSTSVLYGRNYFTKTNTLYYKRGEPGIYGLGYCGGVEPGYWVTGTGNRAIFETGAVQVFTENGQSNSYSTAVTDNGNAMDNAFRMKIQYYPFISSKAIIYKDDISGFQIEKTTYMNEDAQVNDPTLLGSVAKNRVNRLGGTEYTKSGYISSLIMLPTLGSTNSAGQRLTQLIIQSTDNYNKYFATYVNDYNKLSAFVGKKSDYRLYEIPNKNIIDSTRVKRVRFAVDTQTSNDNDSFNMNYIKMLQNMTYTGGTNPKYVAPNLVKYHLNTLTLTEPYSRDLYVYFPVLGGNIGSTAFWKMSAKDNYSAGEKQTSYNITDSTGTHTVKIQQEVPYVSLESDSNIFTETIDLTFKNGAVTNPLTFPDANGTDPVTATTLFSETLDYLKDKREIFSVEYQFSFHSMNNQKIILYNGITEFNSFFNGRTDYNIVAAPAYYRPKREDIRVDLSKIDPPETALNSIEIANGADGSKILTASVQFSKLISVEDRVNAGVIFYDTNTLKLIMWRQLESSVSTTLPYTCNTYFKMLTEDELINCIIYNQGDFNIPPQQFKKGVSGDEILQFLEPFLVKKGYAHDNTWLDYEFTAQLDGQATFTEDFDLFIEWQPISNLKEWQETTSTMYNQEINPLYVIESSEGEFDYIGSLPDISAYEIGYIVRVKPYIEATEEYAPVKYFKVIAAI